MPRVAVVKDRDRDRDGEDESSLTKLSKKYTETQDIDWEDAQMKKYVEEQIRLRDGQEIVQVDKRSEYEKQAQALYQVRTDGVWVWSGGVWRGVSVGCGWVSVVDG